MVDKKITWQLTVLIIIFVVLISLPKAVTYNLKQIFIIPIKYPLLLANSSSEGMINFLNFKEILKENKNLKERVGKLQSRISEFKEAQLENERLHKLLNLKQRYPYQSVAAKVIGKDSSNWINTIILNKGKSDGIEENSAVLSYSGLVGEVTELENSSSKVIVISDPSLKIAAKIQRTRDEGIVEGIYRNLCRMKYLPLDSKILKGDKVITSGYSQKFPEGLLIGKVISVNRDATDLYQIAIIKPEVNILKLEEVLCIKKKKSF